MKREEPESEVERELPVARRPVGILIVGALSFVLTGAALYFTPDELEHWHYILQRLLYFPIIVSGLALGWQGGGVVAVAAGAVYLLRHDALDPADAVDHYLEALMFCLVGVLTGILSDRERRYRRGLEQTTRQLQTLHLELQNNVEQLKRAARMSALGQLSAGLAHEIRNPLASIEGASYIAQTETDEARRSEFLEIIRKETQRLNGLLTHFLKFARPQPPQLAVIECQALAESVLTLVGRLADQSGLDCRTDFPDGTLPIECDPEQVKQVLLNLVLNAIQAMPEGGEITISGSMEAGQVILRVSDNGPGIPSANADQIFDPFFTTRESGTGLGLPIAYQIVQQHRGELMLERNSPQGCRFAIKLPQMQSMAQ